MVDEYIKQIWDDQLPEEEETFLKDLIAERPSVNYRYDIDSDYSLFLAYNASRHGYEGYDQKQTASFKEILQTYRKQKLEKIPEISKVLKALNARGIEPLLIKGVALLAYYAPDIPRMMNDIDIYIRPEQFKEGLAALSDIGYEYESDTRHHVTIFNGKLEIDVHRCLYKNEGDNNSDLFDRLVPCSFLGCKAYVLSPEDMFIHQLANRGLDIFKNQHSKRHLKWILDCLYILKFFEPDLASILEKAKALNNYYYAAVPLLKFVELFPEKFGNEKPDLDDDRMADLLKISIKYIKLCKKYEEGTIKGFRYVCLKLYKELWLHTRLEKIASGYSEPLWKIFLIQRHVKSFSDFENKYKRFVRNKKNGANIN